MRDFRYEETSVCKNSRGEKIKYGIMFFLSVFSWIIVLFLILGILYFPIIKDNVLASVVVYLVMIMFFVASAIVLGRFKYRFNVDYDYTIITGSVRINKVMNNVKNKEIAEFDPADIIKVGKTDDQNFLRISESPDVEELIATSNLKLIDFAYYIYVVINSRKTLVILDCTERFIANLAPFVKHDVICL